MNRAGLAVCLALAGLSPENAHAVLYFRRNAVLANDHPLVAKAASLALDNKAPQSVARPQHQEFARRVGKQGGVCRTATIRVIRIAMVVLRQRGQRGF